jgi:hypothetical protein
MATPKPHFQLQYCLFLFTYVGGQCRRINVKVGGWGEDSPSSNYEGILLDEGIPELQIGGGLSGDYSTPRDSFGQVPGKSAFRFFFDRCSQ